MWWHRLACIALLLTSLLTLQSGAEWVTARSWLHRCLPLVRLASFLPGGEESSGDLETERERKLRLALVAARHEFDELRGQVDALTAFRGRFPDRYLEVVPARVVFRRDPFPFMATFFLDRGSVDGVEEGDAVVWGEALVGQVFRVERAICQARLITDPKMRVPVLVVEPTVAEGEEERPFREVGVMVGRSEPTCVLEFVPWTTHLEPGMRLVSSGFGGQIHRGLVCGTLSKVENDQSAPCLAGEVEPALDIDHVTQLLIVRREAVIAPEDDRSEFE